MTVVQWLADEICRRKVAGRPMKVGIDGRCAAGKTMLADTLAPLVGGRGFEMLRPSVDGFHQPKAYRYRQGEYSAAGFDVDGTGEVEIIRRKYEQRYEPAWLMYDARDEPTRKADVIIDNENFVRPRFLKGGARAT